MRELLDEFAKAAMQGLLASDSGAETIYIVGGKIKIQALVKDAYDIAEAMIAEGDRRENE